MDTPALKGQANKYSGSTHVREILWVLDQSLAQLTLVYRVPQRHFKARKANPVSNHQKFYDMQIDKMSKYFHLSL